ncbi:Sensor histidine kinase regulating citrate/malate metabolism [Actinacidiphila yanglinensis]|uniref:histidine kinase n=1 Tax=Actinacidiphila yanglinensis TaxID=310779 RepID=A0A1H6E0H0_9ACTN|nr:sensor histidine kinase [Actinacidiphila yanglinensis]SEG90643.1 Sensor histidine kinase regulating citrate/malate metabolism [Actinacidiphila yanglinensis]
MAATRVPYPRSLAGQLFAMQAVLVAVAVTVCAIFGYVSDGRQAEASARRQATAVARAVADTPAVEQAARGGDPTAELQPYALSVQHDTGVDFVTIMDPHGIRWTHPDPAEIGRRYLGHIAPALHGRTFAETYTGTLGPSVRVITPIRSGARITGLVSAGITVEAITARSRKQLAALIGVAAGALALSGIGTFLVNARLRRHTHGMNARDLHRMHDYHQAALHAVREGLLLLDGEQRIALINDGGRELLGLAGDAVGRHVTALGLPDALTAALLAPEARVDELHLTSERVVVVNTAPVSGGEQRGTMVTLRDHTELQVVMGELDSERGFSRALRAQAHEAANRLHTVVSLVELGRGREAVDFATAELRAAQALTDRVVAAVDEPVLAALLLGKAAQANERGVELVITPDSRLEDGLLPAGLAPRDLVTVLGNLIDNAVDATQGLPAARVEVTVAAHQAPEGLLLRVADTGPGIPSGDTDAVFERGWSTKPAPSGGRGLGLALARQTVTRNGGTLTLTAGPEGGAVFTARLPLIPPPTPPAHATPPAHPARPAPPPLSDAAARPAGGGQV